MNVRLDLANGLIIEHPTMQWSPDAQTNRQVWERLDDDYERTGPLNRLACWESPLFEESESRRFYGLCWLKRMKYYIRYNELHWDQIARACNLEELRQLEGVEGISM